MNTYRIIYEFDNYEEAEFESQALKKSEEFFEDALGISGMTHRAKHYVIRVEQLDNRGRPIRHTKEEESFADYIHKNHKSNLTIYPSRTGK